MDGTSPAGAQTSPSPPRKHRGLRWILVLGAGALVLAFPRPEAVGAQGWRLLAIFAATVVGLIAQPMSMGAIILVALTLAALTKTVTIQVALSAFANPTIWLIVSAFMFARAVSATGLGRRIAFSFVRLVGSNTLLLGYALAFADFVVSPFIPSDTARAGGIVFPIARSLAESYGSFPGATAKRIGAYLMQCAYHVGCTTAAIFLTSMAANPLAAEFARKFGNVDLTWARWAAASCLPAAISVAILPWLIFRLDRPEIRRTPEAQEMARRELAAIGPMSGKEWMLVAIFLIVISGWISQGWHGLHPAVMALAGVSLIVLCGVIRWDDVIEERRAWDAFLWFGGLVMMADALNSFGVIKAAADSLGAHLGGWPWQMVLLFIVLANTYIHYAFASMTAHITALYPALLLLAVGNGVPPMVAALALAFSSNLNASLTHYGTGPAPIFFGSGYVSQVTWWRVGFCVVLFNLAVWMGLGLVWWRVLGLW